MLPYETFKTYSILYTRTVKNDYFCVKFYCYGCQIRNQRRQKPPEQPGSYNSRW